ncbi:hypothetical protein GA0074695_5553 [Micromonospora viridifaciens]|uniref:Matrixin n=1 Tax=Micromonospora viridifaciens TaxID=1881 RepID=A0A1C4ZH22_MICVI|nr:hypothetical protein [Micromonospora viridifaciens]SCF32081.1 hypothetical protein GA0074695_5553 [Micromonospora viridifaciens]
MSVFALIRHRVAAGFLVVMSAIALTGAPASATAPSDHGDGHVLARTVVGDVVSVTQYTPAKGVSAEALYAKLRSAGVRGLVDPNAVRALDVYQCYYGTAYALESGRCPAIQWSSVRPVVYFRDYSNANWPVSDAVPSWNTSPDIDVWWRTSACPSGSHCVTVNNSNYGATKWAGKTSYSYSTTTRFFIEDSVKIQLNDYYSDTYGERRNTACHEVGHAIGAGHNISTASCIYSTQGSAQNPTSDDINLLTHVIY